MRKYDIPRQERRRAQWIFIVSVLALVAGRIAVVSSREGDTAFGSANDRSRWCTIAALVEHGTYQIDEIIAIRSEDGRRRPFDTIDKVRHVGRDGELHYYSSKPTLLPTLLAGVYAGVYQLTGLTITEHPIYVPRLILLLFNVPVLAVLLVTMMWTIEMVGASDFARRSAMATACFGTMLTPFAISLNNHLVAAAATSVTLCVYLHVSERRRDDIVGQSYDPRFWPWFLAGGSAAFCVANELPSLSMFCLWLVLFAWITRRSIVPFLSATAVVAVGIFGTNFVAHNTWSTPYAHRNVGERLQTWTAPDAEPISVPSVGVDGMPVLPENPLSRHLASADLLASAESLAIRTLADGGYELRARFESSAETPLENSVQSQFHLRRQQSQRSAPATYTLSRWNDWYDYPRSYWRETPRRGVDLGEPNRVRYLFHATFGYYGLFSLTPLWLLIPVGVGLGLRHGPMDSRRLVAAIGLCSIVVFTFYMARPEIDRNYGGVSVCLRWMLWLVPLWLFCIVDVISELSESTWGRLLTILLFAGGVFSVATSLDTPWQSPWILRFVQFLGWLGESVSG